MVNILRLSLLAVCGLAISESAVDAQVDSSRVLARALPVPVFVTNESGVSRRIALRVNNVVVMDTTVGQPLNLTGRVLLDSVRLGPGEHELVLVDHLRAQRFVARLTVRPGGLCIQISLMAPRTEFRAGNYICGFA